jgi:nickel-dependent lactate racemase
MELYLTSQNELGLSEKQIIEALIKPLEGKKLNKVLLIPPDFTRFYSNAGLITQTYFHLLNNYCQVDIMPALGTHEPMSEKQCQEMFGDIPYDRIIHHNWRKDVIKIGEVPKDYIEKITEGLWHEPVSVEINHRIMDPSYDLIISIGQVVPHEVIGMANHSKNLFVGCGGSNMINSSHMIGAVYGMERMMGKDFTPVRKVLDYGAEHFLSKRPILYVLTVTTTKNDKIITHGLFIGDTRRVLEEAIALSQKKNIDFLDRGIKKCIVYLEPKEFHSTWLGNKAVYRTRMAIQDGGELIVLAPGVTKFGEDPLIDKLIRKYGYCGRMKILELFKNNVDLQENMGAAAHLIHGSSDGRFKITYAVKKISKAEVEGVNFNAIDYDEAIKKYNPEKLTYGWNTLDDGEEVFFIPNPALGLWIDKTRF